MMLFKKLCAYLFGWKYAAVRYGMSNVVRRLQKTPDGKEYVVVLGDVVFVGTSYHEYTVLF